MWKGVYKRGSKPAQVYLKEVKKGSRFDKCSVLSKIYKVRSTNIVHIVF